MSDRCQCRWFLETYSQQGHGGIFQANPFERVVAVAWYCDMGSRDATVFEKLFPDGLLLNRWVLDVARTLFLLNRESLQVGIPLSEFPQKSENPRVEVVMAKLE